MKAGLTGRRRSDIVILGISLFISATVWLVHYLSQDYMVHIPFKVCVSTSLDGYATSALSNETIILGGQAKGFYILGKNSSSANPVLDIRVGPQSFKDEGQGRFSLDASLLRESLSEAAGADFTISYVQDMKLSFNFVPQSFVKLPVNPLIKVSCRGQYMQVSEMVLKPDSVTVYGNTSELEGLSGVDTRPLNLKDVYGPVNGVVGLSCGNLRTVPEEVEFFVDVQRYVEHKFTLKITATDVPEGKTMILLPSRAEVVCRLPFGVKPNFLQDAGRLVVDYDDFLASKSTRVAPKLVGGRGKVIDYFTNPPFVDCILSENSF